MPARVFWLRLDFLSSSAWQSLFSAVIVVIGLVDVGGIARVVHGLARRVVVAEERLAVVEDWIDGAGRIDLVMEDRV